MPTVLPPVLRHSRVVRSKPVPRKNTWLMSGCIIATCTLLGLFSLEFSRNWRDLTFVIAPLDVGASDTVCIYDRNNKLVCTLCGNENREPIALKQISPNIQKAVIAAEDRAFYQHHGINPESLLRAAFVDINSGRAVEGGSTITQQLAKNLYSKGESRTLLQKLKEAVIAWKLENSYSKDKLLEAYLNQVYFGRGAYGIERASELYFGKSASHISLGEAAFLAGLINSPSRLSKTEHRGDALSRQALILDDMVACGFIKDAQGDQAKLAPLHLRQTSISDSYYRYYEDAVTSELQSLIARARQNKIGLRVYTNMDPQAQKEAITAINKGIAHAPKGVSQAALVSVSVVDGEVLALVGGAGDYNTHQFNRATNPHTAGSSFKPFVYLSGILTGAITPHTVLNDEPITITQGLMHPYSPRNFDHQFLGPLTVRQALSKSRNVCAVQVAVNTGIENVIKVAKLAGIRTQLNPDIALALGSCAVSPFDMASAYSTFARSGVAIEPQLVRRVEDFKGNVLMNCQPLSTRVFEAEPVAELVDVLQDVVRSGTGTAAQLPGRAVAGKTGTADQAKDLWFVGFTPDTVTATWGGNDENLAIPGSRVTGGSVMASIWRDYMQSYYKTHPTASTEFMPPAMPMDREPLTPTLAYSDFASIDKDRDESRPTYQAGKADSTYGNYSSGSAQNNNSTPPTNTPAPAHKHGFLRSIGHFFKALLD